jgi:3-deoxy-D-manno-octulosonate 8-phosphate phosphatase (KDO 8-P phosphatase)
VIRLLVLDIDGVLTNGEVILDEDGRESKSLFYRDIDAVFAARRAGLAVALVSGESTALVDVIAHRLGVARVYPGRRDKAEALAAIAADHGCAPADVCFVGDSARDAPALELAGLGLAPADAHPAALGAADRVLASGGGRGAVGEAVELALAAAGRA